MNKTITIIIFFVAALMAGIFLLARYSGNEQYRTLSAPLNSLIPSGEAFYDFGTVSMAKGKVSYDFSMKNNGSDPLILNKIYTSCMCTEAMIIAKDGKKYGPYGMPGHAGPSGANIEIGPEDEFMIEAIFDPAAHGPSGVGLNQRAIYIETNSSKTPRVELSFEATVTP